MQPGFPLAPACRCQHPSGMEVPAPGVQSHMWVSGGTQQEAVRSLTAKSHKNVLFGDLGLIASKCHGDKEFSKIQIWVERYRKTGLLRSK